MTTLILVIFRTYLVINRLSSISSRISKKVMVQTGTNIQRKKIMITFCTNFTHNLGLKTQ
jgi:hypothetical protein